MDNRGMAAVARGSPEDLCTVCRTLRESDSIDAIFVQEGSCHFLMVRADIRDEALGCIRSEQAYRQFDGAVHGFPHSPAENIELIEYQPMPS